MKYIMPVGIYLDEKNNNGIGLTVFISMFLKCLRVREEDVDADFIKKFVPSKSLEAQNAKILAKELISECYQKGESSLNNEAWLDNIKKEYWLEVGQFSSDIHEFKNKVMVLNFILKDHFKYNSYFKDYASALHFSKNNKNYLGVLATAYDRETCLQISNLTMEEEGVIYIPTSKLENYLPYFGFPVPVILTPLLEYS